MTRFLRRNTVLRTQRACKIDSVHINGVTDPVIRSWWPRLNIPAIKDILPANRYNVDEFGIMEGHGTNGLVVEALKRVQFNGKSLVRAPGLRSLSVSQQQG